MPVTQSSVPPLPVSSTPAWDYVPPAVYSTQPAIEASLAPPERDFFRSGPDSASETPSEGGPQGDVNSIDAKPEEPGNDKGGGFHW